jgi:hypothetical protein
MDKNIMKGNRDTSLFEGSMKSVDYIVSILRSNYAPCEEQCVSIGEELSKARGAAHGLVSTAEGLVNIFNADWLVSTVAQLEQDIQSLNRLLAERSEQNNGLQAIDQAASQIQEALREQSKVISHVKMLSINARIEAALVSDMGIDFSVFTREIGTLVARGGEALGHIVDILHDLRVLLGRSIMLQAEFHGQHRLELDAICGRLTASVRMLHVRQDGAEQAVSVIANQLRGVEQAIGEVVHALQAGDMTRQRIEHVEHALEIMRQVVNGESSHHDMDENRIGRFCHLVSQLQGHQLQSLQGDFAHKADDIGNNFRQLSILIDGINSQVRELHGADDGGDHSFLLEMEQDLKRTEDILTHYREARQETDESLVQVGKMADAMEQALVAIHDIDAEMHLIGLNASLKCGSIGARGRSLNVVAAELQSNARMTRAAAAGISDHLKIISQAVTSLENSERGDDASLIGHLDKVLRESVASLDSVGSNAAKDLGKVEEQVQSLGRSIKFALAEFTFPATLAKGLRQAVTALQSIGKDMSVYPPAVDPAQEQREMQEFLRNDYTMLRERDVHAALFGDEKSEPSPVEASPRASQGGEVDVSDFLF